MIAEIHGKLSSTGSNLSDRLEDQLTGDVFGALRYIDNQVGLFPILQKSYFINEQGGKNNLNFSNPIVKKIKFWPWIIEAEPDLLINFAENSDKDAVISIEVKYNSGLSSDDQLVRQMRGLKKEYTEFRRIQIFLTTDIVYPGELLSKFRNEANKEGLGDTELYWLSWHDLPQTLEEGTKQLSKREMVIVEDLLKLFERKGFARFSNIEPIPSQCITCFKISLLDTPRLNMPFVSKYFSVSEPTPQQIPFILFDFPKNKLPIWEGLTDGK
jgi:hypothetical protein